MDILHLFRPDVEKLERRRDLQGLIAALSYKNHRDDKGSVRSRAAAALGRVGDAGALEPLLSALADRSLAVRQRAALALGSLGEARAVEALVHSLETDGGNAAEAAEALGCLGDERAVEPLQLAVRRGKPWTRKSAVAALARLDAGAAMRSALDLDANEWRDWGEYLAGKLGPAAVPSALEALQGRRAVPRRRAASLLAGWRVPRREEDGFFYLIARDPIMSSMKQVVALGSSAVEPLIAMLQDEDAWFAVMALGDIGDGRARMPLFHALKEHIEDSREARDHHFLKGKDHFIRHAFAEALAKLGAEDDLAHGIESLVLPAVPSRQAIEDFAKLGALAVPLLLQVVQYDLRAVKEEPGTRGEHEKIVEVCTAREAAVKALGEVGDERAVIPLIPLLSEKAVYSDERSGLTPPKWIELNAQLSLKAVAAEALGKIGSREAIEPLERLSKQWFGNDNMAHWVKEQAEEALRRIRDSEG